MSRRTSKTSMVMIDRDAFVARDLNPREWLRLQDALGYGRCDLDAAGDLWMDHEDYELAKNVLAGFAKPMQFEEVVA